MRLRRRIKDPNVYIPALFVGFFLVVFAANGAMIWAALGSWRGLQAESPWEKSAKYNATLATEAAEAALGWQIGLDVVDRGGGEARVAVALDDAEGRPLRVDRVRVGFVRPTQEGYDTVAELTARETGRYAAEVSLPLAGVWDLRIAAERGGDALHTTRRVTLKP